LKIEDQQYYGKIINIDFKKQLPRGQIIGFLFRQWESPVFACQWRPPVRVCQWQVPVWF